MGTVDPIFVGEKETENVKSNWLPDANSKNPVIAYRCRYLNLAGTNLGEEYRGTHPLPSKDDIRLSNITGILQKKKKL